jgi:hypothetical protein
MLIARLHCARESAIHSCHPCMHICDCAGVAGRAASEQAASVRYRRRMLAIFFPLASSSINLSR